MQYYPIYGITAAICRKLADVRAGRKTDRETCGSARTLRRYACRGKAGTCSAGRTR